MRISYFVLLPLLLSRSMSGQPKSGEGEPASLGATLTLPRLIEEALQKNPEIQAALYQMDVMEAKIAQAGALDDPELKYMREEMPGFRWNEAMYSRIELMQMITFPSKLSRRNRLAEIHAEHAHHEHLEKANDVLSRLKIAFFELWFVQQSIALNRENARLLHQFTQVASTRYGTGEALQQDVLKAIVEEGKLDNDLLDLRQRELGAKAMLKAILNREDSDTLGVAILPEEATFSVTIDSLVGLALQCRPMLLHDSLGVEESQTMLSLAQQEYLPDFKVGLQYVTVPAGDFRGWSISAGITIPFAPWTLAKAGGRVEEASASVRKSKAMYAASRNMVISTVKELYYKVRAAQGQLAQYRRAILPQAQQSLGASLTAYQNGSTGFLMLIDAYRTLVELKNESFMTRMRFEQAVADLERAVGCEQFLSLK